MRTILCIFLMLTGCAAMQESARENYCNYEGAYKLGMNDAREARPMSSTIEGLCSAESKTQAQKGYREGYQSFLKSQPTKIIIENKV